MVRFSQVVFVAACAVLFLKIGEPAIAWESDVHFGITEWLALKAGYSSQEAREVALGNQGVDAEIMTNPIYGTLAACIARETTASRLVHDQHFPSQFGPRRPPDKRTVAGGQVWRDGKVRPVPDDMSPAGRGELGAYLHALQDSWSHQGQPDVPPPCDSMLGWGHSASRGGWQCHIADHTYWQGKDFLGMAQATYDTLRNASPQPAAAVTWQKLTADLAEFSSAETKQEKADWFKQQNFSDTSFLDDLTLPNCKDFFCSYRFGNTVSDYWKAFYRNIEPVTVIPAEFGNLIESFFSGLGNRRFADVQKLVDEETAKASLEIALRSDGPCGELYSIMQPLELGEGAVDGKGAFPPRQICDLIARIDIARGKGPKCDELTKTLKEAVQNLPKRGLSLSEVAERVGNIPLYRYRVTPAAAPDSYLAFGRFAHLPRDVLIVSAERVRGEPRITSFAWMPLM